MIKLGKVGALQFFQLCRQGATIITAILLAKSQLSTQEIGTYEILLYLGFVLSFFWTSGLIQAFLALFPKQDPTLQKRFFFNAYLVFFTLSLLILLIGALFPSGMLWLFTSQQDLPYFSVFLAFLFLNLPTLLLEYFFYLKHWSKTITWFGGIFFSLQILTIIIPVLLGYSFSYSFYGLVLLAFCKHLVFLWFLWIHAIWKVDLQLIKQWIMLASPLLLYTFLAGMTQAFDNWLVNFNYPGDQQLFAVFRYGARELPLVLILTSTFSNALIPEIASDLKQGMKAIKQKSIQLMHLLFPLSILLLLTSEFLFPIVFSPAFSESAIIFNVLILITVSRMVFTHTILIGMGKSQVIVYISIAELLINVLTSIWLAQFFGLWGIAMGSVIAFTMEKVMQILYLKWKFGIDLWEYTPVSWWVGYSSVLVVCFLLFV